MLSKTFPPFSGSKSGLHREEAARRLPGDHQLSGLVEGVRPVRHSGHLPVYVATLRFANQETSKGKTMQLRWP
jgi:hypothetical protein